MTGRFPQNPQVELLPALLEQKPVVANLLELYVHDFSEFTICAIGPDGRFGYSGLDRFWTDPHRFPFLIYVDRELAGFLVVQRIPRAGAAVWDMAEFFILRGYRRHSIGTRAARDALARFPGDWQVRVMEFNEPACAFWNRAIRAVTGDAVRVDRSFTNGKEWIVYTFNSPCAG